jgi:hypothetical protein
MADTKVMSVKEQDFFQSLFNLLMKVKVTSTDPKVASFFLTKPGTEFSLAFNAYVDERAEAIAKRVVREVLLAMKEANET